MSKKGTKNLLAILLAVVVIIGIAASSRAVYDNFIKEESVFALSRLGSSGSEVKQIQQKLKSLGYYKGSVDGIYGTQTKNAVTAFQRNCGITADGICGKTTLLYLGLGGSGSSGGTGNGAYSNADVELLAKVISADKREGGYLEGKLHFKDGGK